MCFTTLVLSKYVGKFYYININHVYTCLRQRKIVIHRAYFVGLDLLPHSDMTGKQFDI